MFSGHTPHYPMHMGVFHKSILGKAVTRYPTLATEAEHGLIATSYCHAHSTLDIRH